MDPDASFSMLLEEIANGEWDDAAEHAESLQDWLQRGGFPPGGGKIRMTSIYALLNWVHHWQRQGQASATRPGPPLSRKENS